MADIQPMEPPQEPEIFQSEAEQHALKIVIFFVGVVPLGGLTQLVGLGMPGLVIAAVLVAVFTFGGWGWLKELLYHFPGLRPYLDLDWKNILDILGRDQDREVLDEDDENVVDADPFFPQPQEGGEISDTLNLGKTLQPHADSVLSRRIGLFGMPGSGKSNALTVFIEELGKFMQVGVPFVLADTEDEYGALFGKKYLMRPYKAGSHNVTPDNAYDFGLQVMQRGLQVILNLHSYENDDDAALVMAEIIRGLRTFAEARENNDRATCFFIFDEAAYWLPQNVRESSLSKEKDEQSLTPLDHLQHAIFRMVVRRGRKRGIGFLFATQRPAELDNRCISCNWLILFRQTLPADLAVYDKMGIPKSIAPSSLADGQAYVIDPYGNGSLQQFRRRRSPDNSKSPGVASLKKYANQWQAALPNNDLRPHGKGDEAQSCARNAETGTQEDMYAQNPSLQDERSARRNGAKTASEQDAGEDLVNALPPGWTQDHIKMLPYLYKACNNLDTCLITMGLSKYERNRDFARNILRQHGLWKENKQS